jgi:hypothetical protein
MRATILVMIARALRNSLFQRSSSGASRAAQSDNTGIEMGMWTALQSRNMRLRNTLTGNETVPPAASPLGSAPFALLILLVDLVDGNLPSATGDQWHDHCSSYFPLRAEEPLRFKTCLVTNSASLPTPPIRADVTP